MSHAYFKTNNGFESDTIEGLLQDIVNYSLQKYVPLEEMYLTEVPEQVYTCTEDDHESYEIPLDKQEMEELTMLLYDLFDVELERMKEYRLHMQALHKEGKYA